MPLFSLNRALMLDPFETEIDLPDRDAVAAHLRSLRMPAEADDLRVRLAGYDDRSGKILWSVIHQGAVVDYMDVPL